MLAAEAAKHGAWPNSEDPLQVLAPLSAYPFAWPNMSAGGTNSLNCEKGVGA